MRTPATQDAFEQAARTRQERTASFVQNSGVGHVPVRTDADYVEPLIAFFRKGARHP